MVDTPLDWFCAPIKVISAGRCSTFGSLTDEYDGAFDDVIHHCAHVARGGEATDTWITHDMQAAYKTLHEVGIAHSVEVYEGRRLIGGLYGILLGEMFFGESMFSLCSNASKVALIALTRACAQAGIELIDCQVDNPHLSSLGATLMPRKDFENHLRDAISGYGRYSGKSALPRSRAESNAIRTPQWKGATITGATPLTASLREIKVYTTFPHRCSYLEGEEATTLFVDPRQKLSPELYTQLSLLGFRRSGDHVYRPHCARCNACIAPSARGQFQPSRTQRISRRNEDLRLRDQIRFLMTGLICLHHIEPPC